MEENERDLLLEAKKIELGLQELKVRILEDMNERLKMLRSSERCYRGLMKELMMRLTYTMRRRIDGISH
jgi:hypothetical protein